MNNNKLCINCIHCEEDKDFIAEMLGDKAEPGINYGYASDSEGGYLYEMELEHHCQLHGCLIEADSSPDCIYMPDINNDVRCDDYKQTKEVIQIN
ncbi:MAG: hypothetical protein ACYDDE_00325 [bacterium]